MKILIADALSIEAKKQLEAGSHEVRMLPDLKESFLSDELRGFGPSILIVRSTKVGIEQIDSNGQLELIVRAGAGFDNIDWQHAADRGIFVANCPGKNAIAVAELAMGLILSLDRFIPDNVSDSRLGQWNKGLYSKARGLKGLNLGILGYGQIGRALAERAKSFEMNVYAWSRSLTNDIAETDGIVRVDSPIELAEVSEVVSIHLASNPSTKEIVDRKFLSALREGSHLVNTSRGGLIDEAALLEAMNTRDLRVGLDVFNNEPSGKSAMFSSNLASHPNAYVTHHIGASTKQASLAIGNEAVRVVENYIDTGRVLNVVNLATSTAASAMITVRHLDKIGVLAFVLDEMRKANWNVQEMENLVFSGENAACAKIKFDEPKGINNRDRTLEQLSKHKDVLDLSLIEL